MYHLPDYTQGSSVEVPRRAENDRLAWIDILGIVRPFPCHLQGSFYRLGTGVHGENPVIAKRLLDLLCKAWKDGIVECTRGQRELLSLLYESSDDLWVTMTLESVVRMSQDDPPHASKTTRTWFTALKRVV